MTLWAKGGNAPLLKLCDRRSYIKTASAQSLAVPVGRQAKPKGSPQASHMRRPQKLWVSLPVEW